MKTFTFLLAFLFGVVSTAQTFPSNTLKFGNGAASDKTLIFNKGSGSTNPKVRWNNSTSTLQFTNDGTNYFDLGSGSGSGGGSAGVNILSNADFETIGVTTNWANSGGSLTAATSGGNLLFGARSAVFDASTSGDYYQSDLYTIPNGLLSRNCMAKINYKGGDTSLKLVVLDGSSNVVTTRTFESASTNTTPFATFFPCPGSGQLRLRVEATGNAAAVALDNMSLGEAAVSEVSQATMQGSVFTPSTAACSWTRSSATYGGFSADTDCPVATTSGTASAPGTKIPGITFSYLPPGEYMVVATGLFRCESSSSAFICGFRFHDGTNASEASAMQGGSSAGELISGTAIVGRFNYTTAQSNITIQMQANGQSSTPADIVADGPSDFSIKVYRFPTSTEQVFRPDTIQSKINAVITGANADLGNSTTVSSYTEITDASLTVSNNTGYDPVGAVCSSTNSSTVGNLTCSAGNEGLGVTFNAPRAGTMRFCTAFSHFINTGSGVSVNTTFQLVETPSNAQTILQEGAERVQSGFTGGTGSAQTINPIKICGSFTFASAGQKTIRLMYEQSVSGGAAVNNLILADADGSAGQRAFSISGEYIDQQTPAPVLVNGVFSSYPGAMRMEFQHFGGGGITNCTSSPCTVVEQSSSSVWGTITRSGAGSYSMAIPSGTYSVRPTCTCSSSNIGVDDTTCSALSQSTTTVTILSKDAASGANTDAYVQVSCIGPK